MLDLNQRRAFADFLDRLALGESDPAEWQTFAVNHYFDEFLEEIRVQCVRMSILVQNRTSWSEEEKTQLRVWARDLRSRSPD
jgi:hypothetical protein